jgi:hypothetical protein
MHVKYLLENNQELSSSFLFIATLWKIWFSGYYYKFIMRIHPPRTLYKITPLDPLYFSDK